ncbi:ion channel protein [Rhodococcus tukisamuensis]|uniref:H+/Cl-antiporter ClcA n=1 Tax=Rhodococcus tukisamuensis TaxID=168276 RepID=A0A1G6MXP5_9NOCA|nr:ion channel protein [Rhodococcus tukisamuensis]SDC59967.1 H+/Cl-antiporter ClcA [Rhodococcus tukisamuensis]
MLNSATAESERTPTTRQLAMLAVPAVAVGVGCALMLTGLSVLAGKLQKLLWTSLPDWAGVTADSRWWTFGMLTVVGLVVGLVVWKMPGHAGPDPATTGLVAKPLAPSVLPSLALVVVVGLAGGVSLGPENPIIAINTALTVWIVGRLWKQVPTEVAVMLAAAATIGALFGTPVAAALVFTEMAAMHTGGQLWNKLFAPLVAAGAGALTMIVLARPMLAVEVPGYDNPALVDLVSGTVIAVAAALLCLAAVYAFPVLHSFFHRLPNPLISITAGGVLLGVLGAIGGPLTLFKGLDEMKELTAVADDKSTAQLVVITVVKLLALLVAATCGFRGGRIFPAVFIGVAVGLVAHSAVPGIPLVVAIATGVLGATIVVARDGWIALFMGAVVVSDVRILPVLCIVILPLWLLVANRPEMLIPSGPPLQSPQSDRNQEVTS